MKTKASNRLLCMLLTMVLALPVLLTVPLRASAFNPNDYASKNIMTVVESVVKSLDSHDEPVYDEIIYSGRLYTGGKSNTGDSYINQTYHIGAGFLFKDDAGDICWATCGTAGAAAPAAGQAYLTFEHMATVIGDNYNNLAQGRNGPHYIVDAANNDPTWGKGMNLDATFVFRCFYYAEKHKDDWNLINDTNCYLQEAITIAYRHEWDTRLIKYGNVGKLDGSTWVENSPSTWREDSAHFDGVVSSTIDLNTAKQIVDAANDILRYATIDADGIKDKLTINDNKYNGGVTYTDSSGTVRTLRRLSAPVRGMQSLFVYKGKFDVETEYSIDLTKVDKDDHSVPLSGAVFELYKYNGGSWVRQGYAKTTDSSGHILWDHLEEGEYRISETKAPSGYEKISAYIYVTLPGSGSTSSSGSYELKYTSEGSEVTVYNPKAKGDLKIKKVDIKGDPISGVTFGVYTSSSKTGYVKSATTGTDGVATFTDLAPGTYYLFETSAPSGYKFDPSKYYSGTVVSNASKWVDGGYDGGNVVNEPYSYTIALVKYKAGSNFVRLPGATFVLYKQDNSGSYTLGDGRRYAFCKTGTTDSDGQITWTGLEKGDYCYVETDAPRGYAVNSEEHYISFPKDGDGKGRYGVNDYGFTGDSTNWDEPETYWTPQVEKNLVRSFDTAREPESNFGEFSFVLEEWDYTERTWKPLDHKSIVGSGTVTFNEITYGWSDNGDHRYRVYEENGDNERVFYTGKIVEFTVTVTRNIDSTGRIGDTLSTTVRIDTSDLSATTDKEKTTFTNYVPDGTWTPTAQKVLIGRKLTDDEFTFTLEKKNDDGTWTTLQTVTNDSDGTVSFTEFYYTLADTNKQYGWYGAEKQHIYRVREVKGTDPTVIYDDHTVTYTVTVSYSSSNATDLTITVDVSSSDPDMDKSEITTFTNYVPVRIEIEKDDPNGHTLAGAEFCLQWSEDGKSWANVKYTAEIEKGGCENADVVDGKLTTDDDGKIAYERLYPGLHYRLTETKAPSGMQLLTESAYEGVLPPDMDVSAPDTTVKLRVVNQPVFTLPATGGHGFWNAALAVPLLCVSIAIIGLALGGGSFKKKKQK